MVFPGIGTVVNVLAVLVGSGVGLLLGAATSYADSGHCH